MDILEVLEGKMKQIDQRRSDIYALHYVFEVFLKGTKDLGVDVATDAGQCGTIHLALSLPEHLHNDLVPALILARPKTTKEVFWETVSELRDQAAAERSFLAAVTEDVNLEQPEPGEENAPAPDLPDAPAQPDPSTISEKSDDVRGTPESVTPQGAVGDGGGTAGAEMSPPATPREPQAYDLVTGPFSEEEMATLIDEASRGVSSSAIAQALGRTEKSIRNKITRCRDKIRQAVNDRQAAGKKSELPPASDVRAPSPVSDLEPVGMWSPKLDLKLAKLMAKGTGEGGAAAVLKLGREDVHVRWKQIKAWVGEPIQSNDDIVQLLAGRLAHHDGHTST